MRVTLAQLQTFERILRLGSFSAAGDSLGLTQPSVSQRIKELEMALSIQLFVRQGPRLSLTADGHALKDFAERILHIEKEMQDRFQSRDPLKGRLRLGLLDTFALICLPDLLIQLEEEYPQGECSVYVGDSATISAKLNAGELDIGIISEPQVDPHIEYFPIGTNNVGWVASPSLGIEDEVHSAADLSRYHLFVQPPPTKLNAAATRWFAQAKVTPSRISTCNDLSTTIRMILRGLAVGLVPVRVMQSEIESGEAREICVFPPVESHVISVCYQQTQDGQSIHSVTDIIRRLIAKHKLFG